MLVASKLNRSEIVAPITTPILLEARGRTFFCLGSATALEEDGSGNWGSTFKLFLSQRHFILDLHGFH